MSYKDYPSPLPAGYSPLQKLTKCRVIWRKHFGPIDVSGVDKEVIAEFALENQTI